MIHFIILFNTSHLALILDELEINLIDKPAEDFDKIPNRFSDMFYMKAEAYHMGSLLKNREFLVPSITKKFTKIF